MPITVEAQPEQHLVNVIGTGSLTQPERLTALARCIELLRANPSSGVLFDARGAVSAPTAAETREIMEMAGGVAPVFLAGVAIVIGHGVQYGMARMLQSMLEDRGVAVAVYTDLAPALAWLRARPLPSE